MSMTPSLTRCLLAILALSENYPHVASKDIAHLLGIKKPTVHHTLESLRERGLIDKELYGDVHLTEAGREAAYVLQERRDDLALLLARHFQLPPDEYNRAALSLMGSLREENLVGLQAQLHRESAVCTA